MIIFLKIRNRTISPRNVFFWGMDLQAKAIIFMILERKRYFQFRHDDNGPEIKLQKYVYFYCFGDISDSDSHAVEESLANTTEKSPTNADEEISANNDVSYVYTKTFSTREKKA